MKKNSLFQLFSLPFQLIYTRNGNRRLFDAQRECYRKRMYRYICWMWSILWIRGADSYPAERNWAKRMKYVCKQINNNRSETAQVARIALPNEERLGFCFYNLGYTNKPINISICRANESMIRNWPWVATISPISTWFWHFCEGLSVQPHPKFQIHCVYHCIGTPKSCRNHKLAPPWDSTIWFPCKLHSAPERFICQSVSK